MKERPLNFNRDSDPEKIIFSNKEKNSINRKINEIYMAVNEIAVGVKDETLEKGFCNTVLTAMESYVIDLLKEFKYYSKLQKDREERCSEIKALNLENRELRHQLGEKVSPEDVREKLKNFYAIINKWWDEDGFGYIHEITFHPYVCSVKLSTRLSIHFVDGQITKLKEKGYFIIETEKDIYDLGFTDNNIKILSAEIVKRFPSAEIRKIVADNLTVDTVEFFIKDFSNI